MRPQRETALGLPAPWGSGLPSLPLGSWWGEASAWDQCCSFLTAHSRRMMTGRGAQRVHGGHRLGPWALAQGITVLVSHIPGRVHTTHASTHPILLSGQRLARSHTHSPSLPHTWSQSKSESYCCAGGGESGGVTPRRARTAPSPRCPCRAEALAAGSATGHLPPRGRAARLPGRCRESHQR